ncbi:MAG: acyl carrier protein [Flammeovirgaceae bacterium]
MLTQKLIEIIKEYIDDEHIDITTITPETHLLEDLKIDSAYLIEIILDVETEYDIVVDDTMLSKVTTLASVEKLILELKG